jgi:hypothetical protein
MNWLRTHLFNLDPIIQAIFFGILAAGLLAYCFWAWPQLAGTQSRLRKLAAELRQLKAAPVISSTRNPSPKNSDPALEHAWTATQDRIVLIGQGEQGRHLLLGGIEDLWQPERLLKGHINLALFEAVPKALLHNPAEAEFPLTPDGVTPQPASPGCPGG